MGQHSSQSRNVGSTAAGTVKFTAASSVPRTTPVTQQQFREPLQRPTSQRTAAGVLGGGFWKAQHVRFPGEFLGHQADLRSHTWVSAGDCSRPPYGTCLGESEKDAWPCGVLHLSTSPFFHTLSLSQLSSGCSPSTALCPTPGRDGTLATDRAAPVLVDLGSEGEGRGNFQWVLCTGGGSGVGVCSTVKSLPELQWGQGGPGVGSGRQSLSPGPWEGEGSWLRQRKDWTQLHPTWV